MAAPVSPTLPSSDELDLADYKLGSFGSDLDVLRSTLERCSNVITPEEYLRLQAAGKELEEPTLDRDELARIVVYVTDWLRDFAQFEEDARKIQAEALTLYHEQFDSKRDPEGWERYKDNIRDWHEDAVDRSDRGVKDEGGA